MRINKIQFLFLFSVLLVTTSCYSLRDTAFLQENDKKRTTYQPQAYESYRIRANDEIYFRIITINQDISNLMSGGTSSNLQYMLSYRVYDDGTIDLPFLNRIPIEGLTINEAEEVVEIQMKKIAPDATVKLALANRSFTIIGDIFTGTFPIYKEKMTIFQALAMSGDLMQSADRKHVRILRTTNEGIKTLEFDIRPASIIESEYYYIYPNDVIYVGRASSSFYKVSNYGSFVGLLTSSITLFFTALYYTK